MEETTTLPESPRQGQADNVLREPPPAPPLPPQSTHPPCHLLAASPILSGFRRSSNHGNSGEVRDSPLHRAAYNGDIVTLRKILNKKNGMKQLNNRNHLGCTPLRLAVAAEQMSCVDELLALGADVHAADIKAQTPVMVAVKNNNITCMTALLRAGADPDGHEHSLYTPLFWAAQGGNHSIVKSLLQFGAKTDSDRVLFSPTIPSSPARIALAYRNLSCFKQLLLAGAEQTQKHSSQRVSLYHLAVAKGVGEEFIRLMYDLGVPFTDEDEVQQLVKRKRLDDTVSWKIVSALFSQPRLLVLSCRITIRSYLLLHNTLSDIDHLPLPTSLIRFLTFS